MRSATRVPAVLATLRQGITEPSVCGREYATEVSRELREAALTPNGRRGGPGGRSSVSGITATIFGCTGFLGRYVTNALAQHGTQCVVPYRCDELDMQFLRPMGDLGQIVQFPDFSVRNEDQIKRAISRSNVVINLIGIEQETPRFKFEEVHIEVAGRIARAAKELGMAERLLHVSCLGASDNAPSRRLRTKAAGEKAVLEEFPDATIFRPAIMVGVEDRLFNMYAQLSKATYLPFVPLIDGGEQRLQPVYVRDVTAAMIRSLRLDEAKGATYELAGPEVFTLKELVELTFDTIREKNRSMYVPSSLAKAMAAPREWLVKRGIPFPVHNIFTADSIAEAQLDLVVPSEANGFTQLDLEPQRIDYGLPIEHVRHFRVGGYEHGTTAGTEGTGGNFFG